MRGNQIKKLRHWASKVWENGTPEQRIESGFADLEAFQKHVVTKGKSDHNFVLFVGDSLKKHF